jgi:RNA polymerase sigma-70 factor (ECF subfamily)
MTGAARVTAGAAGDGGRPAIELAARDSYGRLLAYLAYRWRDIAAAEDALAEAFAAALVTWPRDGVPASPDAWLMTAARRNLLQAARHAKVAADPAVTILLGEEESASEEPPMIPDDRLKLLFVCAHPAIDAGIHTALMLSTVLGLEAKQIAAAFLVKPATLAQRLVRAKAKIRDAALRFEEPEAHDLPERVSAVLEAIYAAYGLGWDAAADSQGADLAGEALYLAQLVVKLLPADPPPKEAAGKPMEVLTDATREPAHALACNPAHAPATQPSNQTARAEAAGLLALLLFCEARRPARETGGAFVPLHEQDTALWDLDLMGAANTALWQAAALKRPGRFQLEAAIQSAHCQRAFTGTVPWQGIATLYAQLAALAPTIGALVGQAVAAGEAQGPAAGLTLLAAMDDAAITDYQPWWVARGYLLAKQGERAEAHACYQRAIGLTEQPATRDYLLRRAQALLDD